MDRNFEIVDDGSRKAELICSIYFEPVADFFVGERFRDSHAVNVSQKRTTQLADGCEIEYAFQAIKNQEEGQELTSVQYCVSVSVSRPFDGLFYWPGLSKDLLMAQLGQTASEHSAVDYSDCDVMEDGSIDIFSVDAENWTVKEVTDYFIDDELLNPRKDIRWEYYDEDGDFMGLVNATDPEIGQKLLSDIPQENDDLHALEESFSRSFSEEDLRMMYGILGKFGFR